MGELVPGAFATLGAIKRELAIYFLLFAALGLIDNVVPGIPTVVGFVLYWLGHYLLFQALLRNAGWLEDDRKRVFRFFFMACLIAIAIAIGLNFLIIPGVILGAKWIMAPAFLVARDGGVFAAMGDSWEASSGNTLHLSLAYAIIGGAWTLGLVMLGAVVDGTSAKSIVIGTYFHLLPVLMMGLSVYAYGLLAEPSNSLVEVFE